MSLGGQDIYATAGGGMSIYFFRENVSIGRLCGSRRRFFPGFTSEGIFLGVLVLSIVKGRGTIHVREEPG